MSTAPALSQNLRNLYLPGLAPDGSPRTLVALDGFWQGQNSDQRRGGPGDAYLPELHDWLSDRLGLSAVVILDQVRVRDDSGHKLRKPIVEKRILAHNVLTDLGAQAMLKGIYNANQTIGQYMVLDTNAATAQISTALTANTAYSSVSVASGGNPSAVTGNKAAQFKNNTTSANTTGTSAGSADPTTGGGVVLSYGTPNADYVSGESGSASTATSIAFAASYTVDHAHAINDWVVANPQTGDGPTSLPGTAIMYNSTAATNGATGTASPATVSGTGIGNRQALWNALIFSTSSTAGSYNNLWIVNQSTIAALTAAADYLNHLSFSPLTLNSSTQVSATYSVKI